MRLLTNSANTKDGSVFSSKTAKSQRMKNQEMRETGRSIKQHTEVKTGRSIKQHTEDNRLQKSPKKQNTRRKQLEITMTSQTRK
jgi:hypothetical protein